MKRRFICLALAMVLVGVTGFVIFLAVTRDPVNETNFDKIQLDMTKTEVVAILGRNPDEPPNAIHIGEAWFGRKGIMVVFDEQDLVIRKHIFDWGTEGIFEGTLNQLRRWLRME